MKYKSVILTKRGGPEVLQIVENTLRIPNKNELQIKILACGVGSTDIAMRYGYYPFAPKLPFIPGYDIIGRIEAKGNNVKKFNVGEIVASLTVHGGYSEYIYLNQDDLVKVPDNVDYGEAVSILLNYITAYQMLNRIANIKNGNKILITGASGGVGTALLDLCKNEKFIIYGTASAQKHDILKYYHAFPIDYKTNNYVDVINEKEPYGLDFVFEGLGGININKSFSLLKKGGKLIEYGYPSFVGMIAGFFKIQYLNSMPNGRYAQNYGISLNYIVNKKPILEDMEILLNMLKEDKIKPKIYKRFPLLQAAEANRVLEEGQVYGKIVLVSAEL